jgi:hypothetical protein
MKEHIHNTARDWINACQHHGCRLYSHDQPSRRRLGYVCFDCYDSFTISLLDFKSTQGALTRVEYEYLRTSVGRTRLADSWYATRWCVLIEDEEDVLFAACEINGVVER